MCVREEDAQRPAARRAGEEHAPLASCAWVEPRALANESGLNRTYLSSVERSERNVSIDNIARIAKGLRVDPWTLLKD